MAELSAHTARSALPVRDVEASFYSSDYNFCLTHHQHKAGSSANAFGAPAAIALPESKFARDK
jgi:hypothetical protein